MTKRSLVWAVCALVVWTGRVATAQVYVDAAATGANNGTSWADAYTDLSPALQTTGSVEVWVARGTYTPAGPGGNRGATFAMRSNLALYGGFAGGESARDQRDPAANETILSGDLNGNDSPGFAGYEENSYHVVTCSNADATAVLDGFTIAHGSATAASGTNSVGGGLFLQNAGPTIANCRFIEHVSHAGGAIYNLGGTPTISRSQFLGNRVQNGRGGAIYNATGTSIAITDCAFETNAVSGGVGTNDGGAIFNDTGSTVTLTRCSFLGNSADSTNRSTAATGGAIANLSNAFEAIDCILIGNTANTAGGVYSRGDALFLQCLFNGNSAAVGQAGDATFTGAVGGLASFSAVAEIIGCVFWANSAINDCGGVYSGALGTVNIQNSILWANTDVSGVTANAQLSGPGSSTLLYSCVQNLFEPIPGEDPPDPANFPGCIDQNPQFHDPDGLDNTPATADDNLRLSAASPCIDAGDSDAYPAWVTADLDGFARYADDPLTTDTGIGTPPIVDMGAYEFADAGPALIITAPESFTETLARASSPVDRQLLVANGKPNRTSMAYSVSATPAWLSVAPPSGSSSGEAATHTVTIDPTGLTVGDYAGTVTVTAASAGNSPVGLPVSLTITEPVPVVTIDGITPNPAQPPAATVQFLGTATVSTGSIVAYEWRSSFDGVWSTLEDFTRSSNEMTVGSHTITFTAWTDTGTSASDAAALTVSNGWATATIVSLVPNPVFAGEAVTVTVDGQDNDEQAQSLADGQLVWPDGLHSGILPGAHVLNAPTSAGDYSIQYRVQDDEGFWSLVSLDTLSVVPVLSTVDAATTPQGDLVLPDWNDTEAEKMSVLRFRVTDPGGDGVPTLIDRIAISISGTAGQAADDIAWAELHDGTARVDLASSITNTQIVFGAAPDGGGTAGLTTVADGGSIEYTVFIYLNTTLLGAHDQTYIFDVAETDVGVDTVGSTQMASDTGAITPVIGTLFITQLGIAVSPTGWVIGPQPLSAVLESGIFTVTNNGNVAEDFAIAGENGAGGWTLLAAPGIDAFRVEVDRNADGSYESALATTDQTLNTNVAAGGTTRTLRLRYAAPTSDTVGAGTAQDFSIVLKASRHVP